MSRGLVSLTHSASALNLPRAAAPAVLRPLSSLHVRTAGGRAGATPLRVVPDSEPYAGIRLTEVLGALSYALDLTEGQPMGHSVRTTMIGMKIGEQLGLSDDQRSALFYTLLLKDLGCSSNASRLSNLFGADDRILKKAHKLIDWTDTRDVARYAMKHTMPGQSRFRRAVHALSLGRKAQSIGQEMIATRCERGAEIARTLSLPRGCAEAIFALDEHWDGNGLPLGLRGSAIPMLARIAGLAQTVEVFADAFDVQTAYEVAHKRRGTWFDPVLVDCLDAFRLDAKFWGTLRAADSLAALQGYEPPDRVVFADELRLDTVAEAFAKVIDAKSPYTARHSQNVAFLASRTAKEMGMTAREVRGIRRAALLHDVGKLGVSNSILDKPSALDAEETIEVRRHTWYTYDILSRVTRFQRFAPLAAAHHERIDGTGYHLGIGGEDLSMSARILAVADVCEALSSDRPYRKGMEIAGVMSRMEELVAAGHLCPVATEALGGWFAGIEHAPDELSLVQDSTSRVA
jgi:putative nucleotidyltransferase with HDIG domain